jgi:hypothetical protein
MGLSLGYSKGFHFFSGLITKDLTSWTSSFIFRFSTTTSSLCIHYSSLWLISPSISKSNLDLWSFLTMVITFSFSSSEMSNSLSESTLLFLFSSTTLITFRHIQSYLGCSNHLKFEILLCFAPIFNWLL